MPAEKTDPKPPPTPAPDEATLRTLVESLVRASYRVRRRFIANELLHRLFPPADPARKTSDT
jgi:hypothetical protein